MRRKLLRTFIACLLISTLFIVPAFAESAVVTGSTVNIRSGPGINYYVIASVKKGTPVTVTNRSNGSWYAVNCNGIDGFISSAYLSLTENTAAVVSPVQQSTQSNSSKFYINAMYVRFRSGPGSSYSVVGEYNKGKEITVVTTVGDWVAGYIDGKQGYVHKQYVSAGTYTPQYTAPVQSGITVVPPSDTGSSWYLPQPNEGIVVGGGETAPVPGFSGGITVLPQPLYPEPVQEPTIVITPAPTMAPAGVIPMPTMAPVTVITPAPTSAPVTVITPISTSAPSGIVVSNPTPAVRPATVISSGTTGYIVGTYVRFRSGPGTNYSILGTYNTGKELIAYANSGNGWLFCSVDGREGYVNEAYVYITGSSADGTKAPTPTPAAQQTIIAAPAAAGQATSTVNKKAYIVGNNVRFRAGASMTSQIIGEFFYGNECVLISVANGWAQIMYGDKLGYVYADYVREGSYGAINVGSTSQTIAQAVKKSSASGQDIVNLAMQYLGTKYCWGGTSPSTGFDCSGFVYYVYSQFGYSLNRVAADQAKNGVHVDASSIQPGDVLCFYSGSSYVGHSGIYIGDNKFIHSSNSTTGVIISELSGMYSSRGYEARRIV